MATRISVPADLHEAVAAWAGAAAGAIELVAAGPADLEIVHGEDGEECTAQRLATGGRLACATAMALASKHGIPLGRVGLLANKLQIKIRACGLGCFK